MLRFALCAVTLAACAISHERPETGELSGSHSLAIDDEALFWVDPVRGVMRAPRGGGPSVSLAPASASTYAPIAITETDVFWADESLGVHRVARTGGAPVLVGRAMGGPLGIAADDAHVYYSGASMMGPGDTVALEAVPLDGSPIRVLAPRLPALALRFDGADLVGTTCSPSGIFRIPRAGGAPTVAVAETFCPISVWLDRAAIYYFDYRDHMPTGGGFAIYRAPRSGAPPEAMAPAETVAFAAYGGLVYTAVGGRLAGYDREMVIHDVAPVGEVGGIAVDDELVYWTEVDAMGALQLRTAPR